MIPSIKVALWGSVSGQASPYKFWAPSCVSRPLKHKTLPWEASVGNCWYSTSPSSWMSLRELMNHVWPVMAAVEKRRSFRGRKVTASRSLEAMALSSSWLSGEEVGRGELVMTFSHSIWKRPKVTTTMTRRQTESFGENREHGDSDDNLCGELLELEVLSASWAGTVFMAESWSKVLRFKDWRVQIWTKLEFGWHWDLLLYWRVLMTSYDKRKLENLAD